MSIQLTFSNNSAEYGGALYIADDTNTGVLCGQSTKIRVNSISRAECFFADTSPLLFKKL